MLDEAVRHLVQCRRMSSRLISLPTISNGIIGKRCVHRTHHTREDGIVADTSIETRTRGRHRWILASSSPTRDATSHFSEQVFTNSKYFCRSRRNGNCVAGSRPTCLKQPAAPPASLWPTPGGLARTRTRRRAEAISELRAMNAQMRSSVSVVIEPPLRRRLASCPWLTSAATKGRLRRAHARDRTSLISWRICSFMACVSSAALDGHWKPANQLRP